jgi:hypothetical protein
MLRNLAAFAEENFKVHLTPHQVTCRLYKRIKVVRGGKERVNELISYAKINH